jgi:hypothetical protein
MFDDRGSRRGLEQLLSAFRSLRRAALEAYRGYLANLTGHETRRLDACHQHMSLEPGRCPYDDEELRPVVDAGEELIHLAYLSGTERMLVTERPDLLEPYGGAAAVLHAPLPGHSPRVGDGP